MMCEAIRDVWNSATNFHRQSCSARAVYLLVNVSGLWGIIGPSRRKVELMKLQGATTERVMLIRPPQTKP